MKPKPKRINNPISRGPHISISIDVPPYLLSELHRARRLMGRANVPWSLSRVATESLLDYFGFDDRGRKVRSERVTVG